jgi:site-specific DNA-methyltransferase (adenine-specific)
MNVVHQSDKTDWETPDYFWRRLDDEFHFDCDVAASAGNAKCERWIGEEEDALSDLEWMCERPFSNPPYGRGDMVGRWMKRYRQFMEEEPYQLLVTLTAARTDTIWFHDVAFALASELRFIKGRLMFEEGGVAREGATFPGLVTVFRADGQPKSGPLVTTIPNMTDEERAFLEEQGYFEEAEYNRELAKRARAEKKRLEEAAAGGAA